MKLNLHKPCLMSIFLLAIFMVGSASACENVTSENLNLSLADEEDICIDETTEEWLELNNADKLESPDDENVLNDNVSQTPTGTEKLNIEAKFNSEYVLDDNDNYFYVHLPRSAAKEVRIFIDGNLTDIKIDPYIDEEPLYEMNFAKLGLDVGRHNVTFSHPGDSRFAPTNKTYVLNLVHFHAYIPKTNWGDESYIVVSLSNYDNGTITVLVDNKVKKKYKASSLLDEDGIYLPSMNYGIHDIEVRYEGILGKYSVKGKHDHSYMSLGIEEDMVFEWDNMDIYFYGDYSFSKTVTIKLNGKSFKAEMKHGDGTLSVDKKYLKIGKNTITLSYSGDTKFPAYTKKVTFNIIPIFNYPYKYDINDKEAIVMDYPSSTKANYILYEVDESRYYDYESDSYKKLKSGSISGKFLYLPKLSVGTHFLCIKYTSNGFTHTNYFTVVVKKNTAGLKSSISKKTIKFGHKIKVKVKSPKLNAKAYVYVDGKKVKTFSLKKGTTSTKIQILSQGKHKVNVYVNTGKKFHSKAYYITIKKPTSVLTLKTVHIKKSAKILVLKATLKKPNGKVIKGKKVTFKFKGKTYKAKTNKKGEAQLTIKKSVLKKLKVGKTVNYQVTYQYTIKKSTKVKK